MSPAPHRAYVQLNYKPSFNRLASSAVLNTGNFSGPVLKIPCIGFVHRNVTSQRPPPFCELWNVSCFAGRNSVLVIV